MESRVLTHLSVEDIKIYLLGQPAVSRRTMIEQHCLSCPECLEQICAFSARVDTSLLVPQAAPEPIPHPPPGLVPPVEQRPPAVWQGLAMKAIAAGLALWVVPNSAKLVHLEHFFESPMGISAMELPFTRKFPPAFTQFGAPKIELAVAQASKPHNIRPAVFYKQFQAPVREQPMMQMFELALLDSPQLSFTDSTIEPLPVELDVIPAAVYHSKPNILKRMLSAMAAPFRSPRT
jgi:hypothetical protein